MDTNGHRYVECGEGAWALHASRAARRFSANPEGIQSQSPGLQGTSYPGKGSKLLSTLKGLRSLAAPRMQPLQGWRISMSLTQGSSFLATLGWMTQSLWDWPLRDACTEQDEAERNHRFWNCRIGSGIRILWVDRTRKRRLRSASSPHSTEVSCWL